MRSELPNLVGRDHMSFRSYYIPVKVCLSSVVLCDLVCMACGVCYVCVRV